MKMDLFHCRAVHLRLGRGKEPEYGRGVVDDRLRQAAAAYNGAYFPQSAVVFMPMLEAYSGMAMVMRMAVIVGVVVGVRMVVNMRMPVIM